MAGPPERASLRRGARAALAALACGWLAACASFSVSSVTSLADPGKYDYHTCVQIAEAKRAMIGRQQELEALMNKADQGTGGALVGALAYRSDYATVTDEMRVIDAAARSKNCNTSSVWQSNGAIR